VEVLQVMKRYILGVAAAALLSGTAMAEEFAPL
jgi:hypothetical protein